MIENFINNKIFSNSNTCKTINIGSFWWVSNIQVTPQKWLQNGQKLSYREVSDQFRILRTRATRQMKRNVTGSNKKVQKLAQKNLCRRNETQGMKD